MSNKIKSFLVILPHQLYEKKYLKNFKDTDIVLWEHPHYFKSYNYNKKKLILHFASMAYYFDYLKKSGFKNLHYINFNENIKSEINKILKKRLNKSDSYEFSVFDPIDDIKLISGIKFKYLESPNFLLKKEDYERWREKTDKFFFNSFYMNGKKVIDVIPKVKSQDKMNRKSLPKSVNIPKIPSNNLNNKKSPDHKWIKLGIDKVEKHFSKNYGNVDNFMFPISHKTSLKWLSNFIKFKFNSFGDYQDFVDKDNQFLFHSLLSTSINIGLLNPLDIIKKIEPHYSKIKLNNYEGFIRQLFWREYQRYCYIYYDYKQFKKQNYFNNKKKLTKQWYTGKTGIPPVDDAIKIAFDTGYLHHINRLMVMGNYMNLNCISPKEGFKWFMEFSCDSYEWVMYQNVYDMVFFASGGKTMRRPYMSSSNYILKMSNYKKGDWSDVWDKKYHDFIKKNKSKLYKFRYFIRLPKN